MSNLLFFSMLTGAKHSALVTGDNKLPVVWSNYLPPVPKICLALAGLFLLASCAAPVDRTKQLVELDLANRQRAISNLQEKQKTNSEPWQAYSLGVLYGAEGEYQNMNLWFARCRTATDIYDEDMEFIRLGHWRDEAQSGDKAADAGQWTSAIPYFEKAILAAPEKSDTRLRLVEARVMAWGPGLEEIRTLANSNHPEAVLRWLEKSNNPESSQQRLEARVRLISQLTGSKGENGDALAAYTVGELCRLDGQWLQMDQYFSQAGKLDAEYIKPAQQIRNSVSGRLLKESLMQWAEDNVPVALAKLDTADVVTPGRADIFQARSNIIALNRARTPSQVAEVLAVGDLDRQWLTFWMSRLYTKNRLRESGMVANTLLHHEDQLTAGQKSQALRVRVAFSRSMGNLEQARDDLRSLLALGNPLPVEAVILGDVLLAQSSYEEASHWFEKAQGWGDNSVSLILKQARIAFSQDRFGTMEELATAATILEPENQEARNILARAQTLNQGSEAVR